MAADRVESDLERRLEALGREQGGLVRVEDIREVVNAVLGTLGSDASTRGLATYRELEDLVRYIESAKRDIAALRPDEIPADIIPSAADELDAIVKATEAATNDILDAAEQIEEVAASAPTDTAERLQAVTTRIYEASNFQDITGQRVTKVVNTLHHIESRVRALVESFGLESETERREGTATGRHPEDTREDAHLLNGPQHEDEAKNQAEIDALLASFD